MTYIIIIAVIILACVLVIGMKARESGKSKNEQAEVADKHTDSINYPALARRPRNGDNSRGDDYIFRIDAHFPDSYTAIDFETATSSRMACQLGVVQVDNNQIVLERCYLIQPPDNAYDDRNIMVHGITPEKTLHERSFKDLWPELFPLFENRFIVAHNAPFDLDVLQKNLSHYGLPSPELQGTGCTCGPFDNVSLYSATQFFGIELGRHHDALADARACALLVQEYKRHYGECLTIPKLKEANPRAISVENKGWADDLNAIPDNYFKGKTVVITGVLDGFSRDELSGKLKGMGARVTSSISRKTSMVIVGESAGPAKLQQIKELQSEGAGIEVFNENELVKILSRQPQIASDN